MESAGESFLVAGILMWLASREKNLTKPRRGWEPGTHRKLSKSCRKNGGIFEAGEPDVEGGAGSKRVLACELVWGLHDEVETWT